jgi:hypothetical protein
VRIYCTRNWYKKSNQLYLLSVNTSDKNVAKGN